MTINPRLFKFFKLCLHGIVLRIAVVTPHCLTAFAILKSVDLAVSHNTQGSNKHALCLII